jgi:high-affinity Fe2+/Pb2+ permease
MAITDTRRPSEKSAVELAGDLAKQTATLVHHEIDLVKVDLKEKARRAGAGAGVLGAGAIAGLLSAGCMTAAAIAALSIVIPVWAGAVVLGAFYGFVALFLAGSGVFELKRARGPIAQDALESTKEEAAWLTKQAKSARR